MTSGAHAAAHPFAPCTAELHVRDLPASVAFWRDVLGFEVERQDPDFAVVRMASSAGSAMVMLSASDVAVELRPGDAERGLGLHLRIAVDDIDAHHERVRAAGVPIVWPLEDRSYGLRDYMIREPDGFYVRFARPR